MWTETFETINTYPEDMIPYWGASKVNMEVCVAILHSH